MDPSTLLVGIRFIDSFFPSGGYAFSSGLEAAVHDGAVRNQEDLALYVEDILRHGIGRCEAVAAAAGCRAALKDCHAIAAEADRSVEAMKFSREARAASRQMGRQVLRVAVDDRDANRLLIGYLVEVEAGALPGHHAVATGLVLGTVGWTAESAAAAFLYQTAVGYVSAALKLLPIGQRAGQRLLARWAPLIGEVTREAVLRQQLSCWTPVHDIYSMRHARLPVRLFRS